MGLKPTEYDKELQKTEAKRKTEHTTKESESEPLISKSHSKESNQGCCCNII
jgi:hypothetical protein